MTFVVTDSCIEYKYTDCVPVARRMHFAKGSNFLAIDPDDCMDCTLCVAECPVSAIFAACDVPREHARFTTLNLALARAWKPIIEKVLAS